MSLYKIFVVEDDSFYRSMLVHHLQKNPDYEVFCFENGKTCLDKLHLKPDIITLDYRLPDSNGKELFETIKTKLPNTPVIIISGQNEVKVAVSLIREGVYTYFIKDENTPILLWKTVSEIIKNKALKKELRDLKVVLNQSFDLKKYIVGNSKALNSTFDLIEKAAKSNINVMIEGETGTGKDLTAKTIHYNSSRKNKEFVAVNLAAIPDNLVESELFGYEKGAFTGAQQRRIGKFEQANGGTLFLDEIGELDLTVQVKLLRVLQEREIQRLGSNKNIPIDVRLICATNKSLVEEVAENRFRQDLFYRIVGLKLALPPLRKRDKDVILLATYFMNKFSEDNGLQKFKISENAQTKLLNYHFPGNIRELKAIIELACTLCEDQTIESGNLQFHNIEKNKSFLDGDQTLKALNAKIITHYLDKYDNNVIKVAAVLDIGKSTIYNMIKKGDLMNV